MSEHRVESGRKDVRRADGGRRKSLPWLRRVPPAVWFFGALLLGWTIDRIRPVSLGLVTLESRLLIALILIVAAAALAGWAIATFHAVRTTILPFAKASTLVDTGPFRVSRNPLYVSLIMILVGFSFLLDSLWILLCAPLLFLALDRFVIPDEEASMRESFGEAFELYRGSVRRWL